MKYCVKSLTPLLSFNFSDATLLVRGCNQLGQFLSHRETNLRYLALESLCLLATSEFSHDSVKKHQETVINALKVFTPLENSDYFIRILPLLQTERDVSVRQRAVDLLYAMCDKSNAEEIVQEMLNYLETADYSIREEMVGSIELFCSFLKCNPYHFIGICCAGVESSYFGREICYRLHVVR